MRGRRRLVVRSAAGAAAAGALLLAVAGCGDQNMTHQARYEAYEEAPLLPGNMANQQPAPGTVARGELAYRATLAERPPMTAALLARGRERFNVFCTPCHGDVGDGRGMIVQRGFPQPPSYHIERLRNAPESYFVTVITDGFGVMYAYADRVPPADRWAIAAYIRALQLSQMARVADLGPEDRRRLEETPP